MRRKRHSQPRWSAPWITRMTVAACVMVLLVLVVWTVPWIFTRGSGLDEAERFNASADIRNGVVNALVAVGAGGALAYTMRTFHMNQAAHLTGRFESAARQIGDENGAVRLAGLYAMAQLADVWLESQQACIEVLCAHARQPAQTACKHDSTIDSRATVLNIVAEHLRPRSPNSSKRPSWDGCEFNLSGAAIKSANLSHVMLRGGWLRLDGAHFSGRTNFDGAKFMGAEVTFEDAFFESKSRVSFDDTQFLKGRVSFNRSTFSAGVVSFCHAVFEPQCHVTFAEAEIGNSGSLRVLATINGGLNFNDARFLTGHGEVVFDDSKFLGPTCFDGAIFGTDISFKNVEIGSTLSFRNASFRENNLIFEGATSRDGIFDLEDTTVGTGNIDVTHMSEPFPLARGKNSDRLMLYNIRDDHS